MNLWRPGCPNVAAGVSPAGEEGVRALLSLMHIVFVPNLTGALLQGYANRFCHIHFGWNAAVTS